MKASRLVRSSLFVALPLLTGLGSAANLSTHEIRPALLEISEQEPGWFEVMWKTPMRGDRVLAFEVVLNGRSKPLFLDASLAEKSIKG